VAPGFEAVRTAFERNFAERGELGGAVAAFVDGLPVVDLWGGYLDVAHTRPWREETIVLVFSTTKGLAAAAVAVAHSRGLLDYEEPVSRYWPEFAQSGKQDVTVRQLLAHQAGLCAVDVRLDAARIADWGFLSEALAQQRPLWKPGRRHGYHAFTLGWYESELLRRVDPQGRRLPTFFAEEVAQPLSADFHIGLPRDRDPDGVATIHGWPAWKMLFHLRALPPRMVLAYMNPRSLTARTMANPRLTSPAVFDSDVYRHLEIPAGVGYGSARAIATIYGDLATGGKRLGLRSDTYRAIAASPVPPDGGWYDLVLHTPTSYGLGWWRPFPGFSFGSPSAFGTPGTGGSFGYADPTTGVGYAYVTNRMGYHGWGDPRDLALRSALAKCLR
jgi:CubicO group peptidase (beta-lactamase class C family)